MRKELITKYISDATKHLIKKNHESYRDVSQKLNLSYGYFRQLMSGNRALTISDIYEIARLSRVPVSNLFPPINNSNRSFHHYKEVTGDRSVTNFKKFEKQIGI